MYTLIYDLVFFVIKAVRNNLNDKPSHVSGVMLAGYDDLETVLDENHYHPH